MRQAIRLISFLLAFGIHHKVMGQVLRANIESVSGIYAGHYIQPAVNALGADFNTGLFHPATVENGWKGLRVYVGLRAFGTLMPAVDRTFSTRFKDELVLHIELEDGTSARISVPATFEVDNAPTIFGTGTPGTVQITIHEDIGVPNQGEVEIVSIDTSFSQETFGGLYYTDIGPAAIPHLEIGTLIGTDLMIRWLPEVSAEKFGSVSITGYGVRHNLSTYLNLPFDLTIQAARQKATLLDSEASTFATARLSAANVTISTRSDNARIFARLQTEQARVSIRYLFKPDEYLPSGQMGTDVTFEPTEVDLDVKSRINKRFTIGFSFAMGPVNMSAGYSFGRRDVLSASIGMLFGAQ